MSPTDQMPAKKNWLLVALIGRSPKRTLGRIVVLTVGVILIRKLLILPIRVDGVSMLPTYRDHTVNFVNRAAYAFHEPSRGDVVAIRLSGFSLMYLKRIVGLPGETISFHNGQCFINGQPLKEPYLKLVSNWEMEDKQLASDEYYVVGDNRSMPSADHTQGIASRERIVGKILL